MSKPRYSSAVVMEGLKDFQRRTVDYVFQRLYCEDGNRRFLVADEVGLGKTLIARGVIARTLEHLQNKVKRIDVVYICSNATIASQNISRLSVAADKSFALASRLTFLPLQVRQLTQNKVNFVSFTPGTTFDLRSKGGTANERALIYQMLEGASWDKGQGLLNILQGAVRKRDWWIERTLSWRFDFDQDLAKAFRKNIKRDRDFVSRLHKLCVKCEHHRASLPADLEWQRMEVIGQLRQRLAHVCLHALEPDLVILDEFQRFKDLLDGESEAAQLARALFTYPNVRTLMLSATPYKMYTLDQEEGEDHYPDFVRTLDFLLQDPVAVDGLKRDMGTLRRSLYEISEESATGVGQFGNGARSRARDRVQETLLRVMCRTERVGMTRQLDAMLTEPSLPTPVLAQDLRQASLVDRTARALGAQDSIEYWKSSPYLLSFLKNYDLRRRFDAVLEAPPEELLTAVLQANGQLLDLEDFGSYQAVDPANPRLRMLMDDTLDRGMWRLLWLPPSLPYWQPTGAYQGAEKLTKSLVFSSWSLVPDAIASMCSYEAERRMVRAFDPKLKQEDLYTRIKPLLRFQKGADERLSGMPTLAWMLPWPALAAGLDPLRLAIGLTPDASVPSLDDLRQLAQMRCSELLEQLGLAKEEAGRADERWYWAVPLLLERGSAFGAWCRAARETPIEAQESDSAETGRESGEGYREHLGYLLEGLSGQLELGPRPVDLVEVLADLALAGPGTCALRALARVAPGLPLDDPALLSAARLVGEGFRSLFNLPESIVLLRSADRDTPYWRQALNHALEGNLQALLDEQAHMLVEQLGVSSRPESVRVEAIARALERTLSMRTSTLHVDEVKAKDGHMQRRDFTLRCRFALRFGELKDDRGSSLARADTVRDAFNSPFRPFILASTSIGQEGLDFHTWCHAVVHWNLPSNPVDLEQREGRVHRYKGHAVRKNLAEKLGLPALREWDGRGDPWRVLFERARRDRSAAYSDIVPYWVYEEGRARVERRVPILPFSREAAHLVRLKRSLALYRLAFGQPRQEDLVESLLGQTEGMDLSQIPQWLQEAVIQLMPPVATP